jgi:mandelate racemase
MDWADKIVQEPLAIIDGHAVIPDRPGHGIVWDTKAVERYRV